MSSPLYYDPYKPEIAANPYPVFKRLREEAPLYYNEQHDFWAVSRFADVEKGLQDAATYISGKGAILEIIKANAEFPAGVLIFEDPPVHTVHRNVLARLFTPRRMNALEPKIQKICADLLEAVRDTDRFDLIGDYGAKMPMRVIGELLGIPEEDHAAVRERVDQTLRTEAGKPMVFDREGMEGGNFEEYIEWRSKHPSDDVMTELMNAEFQDETGTTRKLRREEILTLVNVVAGAGNETTTRLIGWFGKVLAEHPDQRRAVAGNPTLIPQTIEEVLRFEPPAPHNARYMTRDVELYGKKVPKGSVMMFLMGAANRDESRFVNGDSFDIMREPKSHVTFGYGIHACLGRVLARLEGRIALAEFLKRFPEWEVDMDHAHLSPTSTVRGWETLPIFTRPDARASAAAKAAATPAAKPAAETGPVPIEGKWNVTIKSPTGPMPTVLTFERVNGALTGTQSGQGTTTPISEIKVEGNEITWINQITKPMKMKLTFTGTRSGRQISGKVKAGFMGSFAFSGEKE